MPPQHTWSSLAATMVERQLRQRGIDQPAVLDAMAAVPRHRFIPNIDPTRAYGDHALPIGAGQTISQPYMVALMTELLRLDRPGRRILEIGCGSGYQAAILAHMGAQVVTLERHGPLAEAARRLLAELGYADRIQVIEADGTLGYPDAAPYHGIIVTAAAPHVPDTLKDQTADGGRIVIPIGDRDEQQLMVYHRQADRWTTHPSVWCRFVPLIGAHAWPDQ